MKHIITTAIIKGGTGKSTTAAALAQAAHENKKKVLAIDLDPQGNLTMFLGGNERHAGSYDLLHGRRAADVIQTTPQEIDLISASPNLATEKTAAGSVKRLQNAIEPIKEKYDYIFIDTPPSMGELTYNALQASTALLIPLDADTASLKGLAYIADVARKLKADFSFIGVLITRYRGRANINQLLRERIEAAAEAIGAAYFGEIRDGVAIREAQATKKDIFEYAAKSNPAQDYIKVFNKIKGRK